MADKVKSILVIPDAQVRPGVDVSHLSHIGQYIADKRPDAVVNIGDFADMSSLSSYDRGKRSFEGRTYADDIKSVRHAMGLLMAPFKGIRGYKPKLIFTLGNHEERILRAIEEDGRLYGTISMKDLGYEEAGWEVHPFLEVVMYEGIAFAHYFCSGPMQRPVTSARALVKSRHCSAVMGHTQTADVYLADQRPDGRHITGLFCGTAYSHFENYLGPQGNSQRRQVVMLNDVRDGEFDLCFVSLRFLARKYGRKAA